MKALRIETVALLQSIRPSMSRRHKPLLGDGMRPLNVLRGCLTIGGIRHSEREVLMSDVDAQESCREIIRQVLKLMSQGKSTKHLIDQMETLKRDHQDIDSKQAFKEVCEEIGA